MQNGLDQHSHNPADRTKIWFGLWELFNEFASFLGRFLGAFSRRSLPSVGWIWCKSTSFHKRRERLFPPCFFFNTFQVLLQLFDHSHFRCTKLTVLTWRYKKMCKFFPFEKRHFHLTLTLTSSAHPSIFRLICVIIMFIMQMLCSRTFIAVALFDVRGVKKITAGCLCTCLRMRTCEQSNSQVTHVSTAGAVFAEHFLPNLSLIPL